MNVAYVSADPGIPVFGNKGASVHVQEILRAFSRRGADVTLFTPRLGGGAPDDLRGVEVRTLPAVGAGDCAHRERQAQASAAWLPDLLSDRRFDLVYERYSLWSAAALEHAAGRGIPTVLEVNAPLVDEQARYRRLVDRATAEATARRAMAAADLVVAVSEPVAAWSRDRCPDPARVHVVGNGVDPARFSSAPAPDPGCFTVGFVGTLRPWHGVDVLVRAVARLARDDPAWRLLVVGDGPERARLERLSRDLDLRARVTFAGAVPPAAVPALLRRFDVAAAPYPFAGYFSPLKVVEYLAAGLPVVASDVPQVAGLVRPGDTGVVCRPGDAADLAAALVRVRRDPARRRLGRNGRDLVTRTRTWDRVLDRILGLVDPDWSATRVATAMVAEPVPRPGVDAAAVA